MRMQDSQATDPVPQSLHAQQLERGFPWLRFEPTLEQEFRQRHRSESLPQLRRNLWIAAAFMAGFSLLTHLILDAGVIRAAAGIRYLLLIPILAIGLFLTHSKPYQRFYP